MRLFISIAFFSILFFSLQKLKPSNAIKPCKAVELGPEVPGIPTDVMVQLLNQCTYIDYIFKDLPFSVSQNEDQALIKIFVLLIQVSLWVTCHKIAPQLQRKFFQINGR